MPIGPPGGGTRRERARGSTEASRQLGLRRHHHGRRVGWSALVALGDLLFGGHLDMQWTLALLIGAPIAALMSRFPLVLNRSSSGIEVGFDSAVLVFLVCFHGGAGALGIWAVGQALSQVNRTKRTDVRMFNVGLGILSGFVAVARDDGGRRPRARRTLRELSAVAPRLRRLLPVRLPGLRGVARAGGPAARCAASCARAPGWPPWASSWRSTASATSRPWSQRGAAAWAILLLAVPVFTILVATRALSRGREHRRRLSALFDAAAEAQVVESASRAGDGAARQRPGGGREPVRRPAPGGPAAEGDRRPGPRRRARRCGWWRRRSTGPAPRSRATARRLEALATVGEEAFARLSLTDEMGRLARHDALTSLPNRTLFLDRVEQGVIRARRNDTDPGGAVPRPGRLQGRQRPVRPRRGRRAAQDRGGPAGRLRPRRRLGGPAGRRRVRRAARGRGRMSASWTSCASGCSSRCAARSTSWATRWWWAPASGSPWPTAATTPPACCATPTWRCTGPRRWARTGSSSTSRRCARRTSAGWS